MEETVFHTERLAVRRWTEADLPSLFAVYSDREAMRWVGDGNPLSHEDCARWLDITRNNYATRGYGMFAVEARSEPGLVGCCGLVHPGGQADPEVKYAYLRSHWGLGFATEAARGMISYGLRSHGLKLIVASAAPENAASHRVLVKAGMQHGHLRANGDGSFTQMFFWQAADRMA